MTKWPTATRTDDRLFCETEGWTEVRDAKGPTGTHHVTYELQLPDGRILRTRISHPSDRSDYGKGLWSHILRDQLGVAESEFWACVNDGILPDRGVREPPKDAIPAALVRILLKQVGLDEAEVAQMTKQDAIDRVNRFWTEGQ